MFTPSCIGWGDSRTASDLSREAHSDTHRKQHEEFDEQVKSGGSTGLGRSPSLSGAFGIDDDVGRVPTAPDHPLASDAPYRPCSKPSSFPSDAWALPTAERQVRTNSEQRGLLMSVSLDDLKSSNRPVVATCNRCGRVVVIPPYDLRLPGNTPVIDIGRRLRCTHCGKLGAAAYPQTTRRIRQGRER